MDWNWFFSSFAQSSAAIVGIFGAFLITKILNNQALFSQKNSRAKDVIVECKRVMDLSKNRYFNWYNEHINKEEYEKLRKMLKKGSDLSATELYSELNFSIFTPKDDVVQNIQIIINNYEEEKRKKELIDATLSDVKHHIRIAQNMMNEISGDPECSSLITKMLVFVSLLFFLGVIYPLSFLPASVGEEISLYFDYSIIISHIVSIKGIFLILLSVVFSSILITFFLLNINLKYSNELVLELMECKKLSSYSEYFAIMEENEQKNRKNSESNISQ